MHYSNEHVIVMEFIPTLHSLDAQAHRNAAEVLAELHKIRAEQYGFERDTVIGSLKQPKPADEGLGVLLRAAPPIAHGAGSAERRQDRRQGHEDG